MTNNLSSEIGRMRSQDMIARSLRRQALAVRKERDALDCLRVPHVERAGRFQLRLRRNAFA